AQQLGMTERTVKMHLGSIFQKLGVRDRVHLVLQLTQSNQDSLPRH
ncbi:MAG TPA: helix-turn-helix transcriptional regulator, partial [Thioalkalivibrio sp.]|nr:helix-turn-helix transcriptional regulator [Thioalkalivibrio sp.]